MYVLLSPCSSSSSVRGLHTFLGCVVPVQVDSPVTLISLWVADVEAGVARQLLGPPQYAVNTILEQ